MSFSHPLLLLGLLVLPWWWWRRRARRGGAVGFSDASAVEGALGARGWLAALPEALRITALAGMIIGAAGPRAAGSRVEVRSEGISIVLAVDVSSSMLAEDFAPENRLDVARRRSIEFVRARRHDRLGLVAFAGEALTQVPVTVDHAVVERAVTDLRVAMLEDGTAIGTAIATAANRLARLADPSQVIILLTDGENNRGTVDPRTAAAAAAEFGIRIYTIGVGTEGEAPVPTGRGPEGLRYQTLPVRIDEALLTEVATTTGGRYFRATDDASLGRIYEQIDRLERTPVTQVRYVSYAELYGWLLGVALLALGLEVLISGTLVVRIP
jgi:Ca-activated chloride channel family protein